MTGILNKFEVKKSINVGTVKQFCHFRSLTALIISKSEILREKIALCINFMYQFSLNFFLKYFSLR
jgi:hypothetical protein